MAHLLPPALPFASLLPGPEQCTRTHQCAEYDEHYWLLRSLEQCPSAFDVEPRFAADVLGGGRKRIIKVVVIAPHGESGRAVSAHDPMNNEFTHRAVGYLVADAVTVVLLHDDQITGVVGRFHAVTIHQYVGGRATESRWPKQHKPTSHNAECHDRHDYSKVQATQYSTLQSLPMAFGRH